MTGRILLSVALVASVAFVASCQNDTPDAARQDDQQTESSLQTKTDQNQPTSEAGANPANEAATSDELASQSAADSAVAAGDEKLVALPRPVLYQGDDPAYVAPGTKAAMRKAIDHLRKTQNADGGWSPPGADASNLGISAVALTGLASAGVPADDKMVSKAVSYILSFARDDGGIHDGTVMNYTTSLAVMALTAIDAPKYEAIIRKAAEHQRGNQWGSDPESADFGGAGYGGQHNRPDMSNTTFAVMAWRDMQEAGMDVSEEMKRAMVFVSRNQNGEANRGYWQGAPDDRGGFIYTTHKGGESKAGDVLLASGGRGLKAYGSMTYAGFLSLIYAGLDRDDQRVQAALDWISKNWTLEENPEMGLQGYYYYLMTMGKALHAYGQPTITDDQDTQHQWRKELTAKMLQLQGEDGAWVNDADRWHEGAKPVIVGYGLITLSSAVKELPAEAAGKEPAAAGDTSAADTTVESEAAEVVAAPCCPQ